MKKHSSRGHLYETAFVSRSCSSAEDLDEVDRLANHPVLRTAPQERLLNLRKSRSETEDVLLLASRRARSGWTLVNFHQTSCVSSAPTTKVLGRRAAAAAAAAAIAERDGFSARPASAHPTPSSPASSVSSGWVFHEHGGRIQQQQPQQRTVKSAPSTPPVWWGEGPPPAPRPARKTFLTNSPLSGYGGGTRLQLVTAVIETDTTPSTTTSLHKFRPPQPQSLPLRRRQEQAPPPTSSKSTAASTAVSTMMEGSSTTIGSNNEISVEDVIEECANVTSEAPKGLGFRLPLSLKPRLKHRFGDGDSSSAESTPQRRQQAAVRRGLVPKAVQDLSSNKKTSFFGGSGGDSSCSSAMSSLESIRSNASDGVHSLMSCSESGGAVSSISSSSTETSRLELRQGKHAVGQSKFQVLSPISDKSQEQYSEEQRTPTNTDDNTTTPCDDLVLDNDIAKSNAVNNNNNGNDMERALDVPWDVPKLKRRLENLNMLRQSSGGTSTNPQEEKRQQEEIGELLNVPWDMPKLRRRKDLIGACAAAPLSLPRKSKLESGREKDNLGLELELPPPPPGFEDSGDEYYFGETSANSSEYQVLSVLHVRVLIRDE